MVDAIVNLGKVGQQESKRIGDRLAHPGLWKRVGAWPYYVLCDAADSLGFSENVGAVMEFQVLES